MERAAIGGGILAALPYIRVLVAFPCPGPWVAYGCIDPYGCMRDMGGGDRTRGGGFRPVLPNPSGVSAVRRPPPP